MKSTIFNIVAGTFLTAALVPAVNAAERKPINARQQHQQQRIRQGVKSGELTRHEAVRLEQQQARIRVNERFAKADGELTAAERLRIQQQLTAASNSIHTQKHDRQDRN